MCRSDVANLRPMLMAGVETGNGPGAALGMTKSPSQRRAVDTGPGMPCPSKLRCPHRGGGFAVFLAVLTANDSPAEISGVGTVLVLPIDAPRCIAHVCHDLSTVSARLRGVRSRDDKRPLCKRLQLRRPSSRARQAKPPNCTRRNLPAINALDCCV